MIVPNGSSTRSACSASTGPGGFPSTRKACASGSSSPRRCCTHRSSWSSMSHERTRSAGPQEMARSSRNSPPPARTSSSRATSSPNWKPSAAIRDPQLGSRAGPGNRDDLRTTFRAGPNSCRCAVTSHETGAGALRRRPAPRFPARSRDQRCISSSKTLRDSIASGSTCSSPARWWCGRFRSETRSLRQIFERVTA